MYIQGKEKFGGNLKGEERVKLTEEEKQEILLLFDLGILDIKEFVRLNKVDKSAIIYFLKQNGRRIQDKKAAKKQQTKSNSITFCENNNPKQEVRTQLTEEEKRDILLLQNLGTLDPTEFATVRSVSVYAIHYFLQEQAEIKEATKIKRRRKLLEDKRVELLRLFDSGTLCVRTLAQSWGVGKTSLYNVLKQNGRKKKEKTKKSKPPIGGYLAAARRQSLLNDAKARKLSVPKLAEKYKISRQAVYALLQRRKIPTVKKEKIGLLCPTCQTQFLVSPSHKNRKFCSRLCSDTWQIAQPKLNSGKYRLGQRIARSKLEQYIQLEDEWIIWHADRNWLNGDIGNLQVFDTFQNLLYHLLWNVVDPVFNGKDVE